MESIARERTYVSKLAKLVRLVNYSVQLARLMYAQAIGKCPEPFQTCN